MLISLTSGKVGVIVMDCCSFLLFSCPHFIGFFHWLIKMIIWHLSRRFFFFFFAVHAFKLNPITCWVLTSRAALYLSEVREPLRLVLHKGCTLLNVSWTGLHYMVLYISSFFLLIKLQTLPDQEEAKKVMALNTFSFPSTCLRQTYRITSMVKRF